MRKFSKTLLLISLILLVGLILTGCGNGGGRNATDAKHFDFDKSSGSILGIRTENISKIIIPSKIDGVVVKKIAVKAFHNSDIALVDIPNGVQEIGEQAFAFNRITSVEIPGSVEKIGQGAFMVNELTSVDMSNGVQEIGKRAFISNRITSVEIPGSVKKIGWGAFRNNEITSVEIPGSVEKIGDHVFDPYEITFSMDDFGDVYDKHNNAAGVYVRDDVDSDWYKQ